MGLKIQIHTSYTIVYDVCIWSEWIKIAQAE